MKMNRTNRASSYWSVICSVTIILIANINLANAQGFIILGPSSVCKGDISVYSMDHPPDPNQYYTWTANPAANATIYQMQGNQVAIQWNLQGACTITAAGGGITGSYVVNVWEIFSPYITYNNEVGCQNIFSEGSQQGNFMITNSCINVCEGSEVRYTVHGNLYYQFNGSSFDWKVNGGVIIEADGTVISPPVTELTGPGLFSGKYSEVVVRWGNTGPGFLKVTETTLFVQPLPPNEALFCKPNSAELCFDIIEIPYADFLFDNEITAGVGCYEICKNQIVHLKDKSTGSVESPIIFWQWDFGDGSPVAHMEQPSHKYTQSGEFLVTLTVTNRCGCTHSMKRKICVHAMDAIPIECPSVVCENSTAQYKAIGNCSQYNWSVSGGQIIPNQNDLVDVLWDQVAPDGFGYLSLDGSFCDNVCPLLSTIRVPVVLQETDIEGPTVVCSNSQYIYKLPPWPATNFSWKITPAGALFSSTNPSGIVQFNTIWGREHFIELGSINPGTFELTCFYQNTITYPGCTGKSKTITITILDQAEIAAPEKI